MTDQTVSRLLDIIEKQAAPSLMGLAKPIMAVGVNTNLKAGALNFLAGKKTYIVSALGIASSLALGGITIVQSGATVGNVAAMIAGLLGSSAVGTLRSALANHAGTAALLAYDIGEQVLLQVLQAHAQQAPAIAAQVIAQTLAPAAAPVVVATGARLDIGADGKAVVVPQAPIDVPAAPEVKAD